MTPYYLLRLLASILISWLCLSSAVAAPADKPGNMRASLQELATLLQQKNLALLQDRQHIETIASHYLQNDDISEADFNWLKQIAADYRMPPQQRGDQTFFRDLLLRVDAVPTSLALAQAVMESGLRIGDDHNPFGRHSGKRHETKRFASLQAAIDDYLKQLNTGKDYQNFRQQRAQLRNKNRKLHGEALAAALSVYSDRRTVYTDKLKTVIAIHQLAQLD